MNDHRIELRELLNQHTVRAQVEADSWEQAADIVGQMLVDTGAVEPRYVEAMKRAREELGPYMVIASGIALLHARPEAGVNRLAMGLITLKTPVEFGHSENDPVDLVFALAAVNKEAHLGALQVLASMLMDEDVLVRIRSATSTQELLSVFETYQSPDIGEGPQ